MTDKIDEKTIGSTHRCIIGCILGTAVGDALGLPYEGLSSRRASVLLGKPDRYRFLYRYGLVSDDTEHTLIVTQALISSSDDVDRFSKDMSRRLRWWLMGLPAGIGYATLRSIFRLCIGFSTDHSGVFSAGNGPAMRAAILGAAIDDPIKLRRFTRASTIITHTDPKAEYGAFAVALASHMASKSGTVRGRDYFTQLSSLLEPEGDELIELIRKVIESIENEQTTIEFARSIGARNGVSGYIYSSVPVAIHAWLYNQLDFRCAIISIVECGGDTDTVAAIAGGIIGSAVGKEGIPIDWLTNLKEWPRTLTWMERLAVQLANCIQSEKTEFPIACSRFGILPRNFIFLLIVLSHGFRRLLPPY